MELAKSANLALEERNEELQAQLETRDDNADSDEGSVGQLKAAIEDLEAENRKNERIIGEHEDELEELTREVEGLKQRNAELEEELENQQEDQVGEDAAAELVALRDRIAELEDELLQKVSENRLLQSKSVIGSPSKRDATTVASYSADAERKIMDLQDEVQRLRQSHEVAVYQHNESQYKVASLETQLSQAKIDRDMAARGLREAEAKISEAQASSKDQADLLKREVESLNTTKSMLEEKLAAADKEIASLNEILKNGQKNGQPVSNAVSNVELEHVKSRNALLQEEVETLSRNLVQTREDLRAKSLQLRMAETKAAEAERLTDATKEDMIRSNHEWESQLQKADSKIQDLEDEIEVCVAQYQDLKTQMEEGSSESMDKLVNEVNTCRELIHSLEQEKKEREAEMARLHASAEKEGDLRRQIESYRQQISRLSRQTVPDHNARRLELEQECQDARQSEKYYADLAEKLQQKLHAKTAELQSRPEM